MSVPFWLANFGYDGGDEPRRELRRLSLVPDEVSVTDPDAALVESIQTGDERAFRSVWDRYHARLADFADKYVRSPDTAADVVQHVFVALWNARETLAPRGTLLGYLHAAVRHRAWNVIKHERLVQQHIAEASLAALSDVAVVRNLGETSVEMDELVVQARKLLATLPPKGREIFLMHREDGLAPVEIAQVLGLAPQTVYNQLARATKVLAEGLARWRALQE